MRLTVTEESFNNKSAMSSKHSILLSFLHTSTNVFNKHYAGAISDKKEVISGVPQ